MKVKYFKVVAIDNYKLSANYGKQVEFIIEDNGVGRKRMSLYDNPRIVDTWEEDFSDSSLPLGI